MVNPANSGNIDVAPVELVRIEDLGVDKEVKPQDLSLYQKITQAYKNKIFEFVEFLKKRRWYVTSMVIGTLLSEPLEALKAAFLWPSYWKKDFDVYGLNPKVLSREQRKKNPVLLIHGNYHNPTAWLDLAEKLKEQYKGPVYTISLPNGGITSHDFALLNKKMKDICNQYQNTDSLSFNIIGHSRGGFLARATTWYEESSVTGEYSCPKYSDSFCKFVTKVITLGSPAEQSAIDILRTSDPYLNKRLYEITGEEDVLATDKSLLSENNHLIVKTGHLGLLYSDQVHKKIIQILNDS